MGAICLLVRIKLWRHTKRKYGKQLYIRLSSKQATERDNLFNLYLQGGGKDELSLTLHNLLVSLLCHTTNDDKLACPTDYALCIACLDDQKEEGDIAWCFKSPSRITGLFAKLQYCFRMIFFTHCWTIAKNGGTYKPLHNHQFTPFQPSSVSDLMNVDDDAGGDFVEIIDEVNEGVLADEGDEFIDGVNGEVSDNEGNEIIDNNEEENSALIQ